MPSCPPRTPAQRLDMCISRTCTAFRKAAVVTKLTQRFDKHRQTSLQFARITPPEMFDKTLRWLIEDMRPFRSVETPAFREVCDAGVKLPRGFFSPSCCISRSPAVDALRMQLH